MEVYRFNHVFDHIEVTLREHFGNRPEYDKTLVVLGYNVLKSLDFLRVKYPGFKIVIYQLEHLMTGSPWVNRGCYDILKSADEVWDYDELNIRWMADNYKIKADKFLPLLYTNALKRIPPIKKDECDIDVLFYGYIHERRARLLINLQHVMAGKFKVFDLYGVWGEDLDEYIRRAKIIINLRSRPQGRQEQPRIYYPVINGRCVLSERNELNYFGDAIIEEDYLKMVDKIMNMLKTGEWLDVAQKASERYKMQSKKYERLL